MSPEYLVHGLFSTKSDVFSFGVIMLEIVSGRRNVAFSQSDCILNLLGYVSVKAGQGCEIDFVSYIYLYIYKLVAGLGAMERRAKHGVDGSNVGCFMFDE